MKKPFEWDFEKILEIFRPRTFDDCKRIANKFGLVGQEYINFLFELFYKMEEKGNR